MMSMSLYPRMILGMACTVCGLCDGAGTTHASDTDTQDAFIGATTSNKDIPTAAECPKCGKRVYPDFYIYVNRNYKACVKEKDKIRKHHDVVAGPLTKWEAVRAAKELNKVKR